MKKSIFLLNAFLLCAMIAGAGCSRAGGTLPAQHALKRTAASPIPTSSRSAVPVPPAVLSPTPPLLPTSIPTEIPTRTKPPITPTSKAVSTTLSSTGSSEPTHTSPPFLPPELAPINPGNVSRLKLVVQLPDKGASVLAFSPDSQWLAAGLFTSNLIKIWDLVSGQELLRLNGHIDPRIISYIAFSPDGAQLASAAQGWDARNDSLILWDSAGGGELQRFNGVLGALSPDWQLAAVTRRESMSGDYLDISNLAAGELIHRFEAPGEIYRVTFFPQGELVSASMYDVFQDLFSFWQVQDGSHYRTMYDWLGFSFSMDGRYLAAVLEDGSGSDKGTLNVYSATDFKWVRTLAKGADSLWYTDPAFSPDGELLAASFDGHVRFWETQGWVEIGAIPTTRPTGLLFSPDGRMLITHTHSEPVQLWGVINAK